MLSYTETASGRFYHVESPTIQLPLTVQQLEKNFPNVVNKYQHGQTNWTETDTTVLTYCLSDFYPTRRSLGSTVILAIGASGSGKSKTINTLFGSNIFQTGDLKSTTQNVSAVRKRWTIPVNNVSIYGDLCFLDVPGFSNDTDGRDTQHMESIRKIRQDLVDLQDHVTSEHTRKVHPNIVLFALKPTTEKVGGENSHFVRTLKALSELDYVDCTRNNLIIVITHVMNLSMNNETVRSKLMTMINVIKKIVWKYLHILDVPVVPVENEPEDYNLPISGDFHLLPTGHLNCQSIFDEMLQCVSCNGDILGKLMLENYNFKNPEMVSTPVQNFEVARAYMESAKKLVTSIWPKSWRKYRKFDISVLGQGYCPVKQNIKSVYKIHDLQFTKPVAVGDRIFSVPEFVHAVVNDGVELTPFIKRETFYHENDFERHMELRFNFDTDMTLNTDTQCNGNWIKSLRHFPVDPFVRFSLELELCRFVLNGIVPCSNEFNTAMANLPLEYSEITRSQYWEFFQTYGTHFVAEQIIGKVFYWEIMLTSTYQNIEDSFWKDYEGHMLRVFKNCLNSSNPFISSEVLNFRQDNRLLAGENVKISSRASGNSNPQEISLAEIRNWLSSILDNPIELGSIQRLEPYYNQFPVGPKYSSMRQATLDYISQSEKVNSNNGVFPEQSFFANNHTLRLYDGQDARFDELSDTVMALCSVHETKGVLGTVTTTNCLKIQKLKTDCLYELVRIKVASGMELVASPNSMVWKYNERKGFFKTEIRLCRIRDSVGCYGNDINLQKHKIIEISHEWQSEVVYPVLSTEPFNLVVNGFLVGIISDGRQISKKSTNESGWLTKKLRRSKSSQTSDSNDQIDYESIDVANENRLDIETLFDDGEFGIQHTLSKH